ncbi:MAG: hypothetical protein CFE43_01435 [Burkholderiales bacterium PBB3]|nr:MAG: hypothetical protein CFE43_01435 [Burkholderiales bacterium PBB3]
MLASRPNLRLTVVTLLALSVSLPMAALSLAKLLLFFTGLCFFAKEVFASRRTSVFPKGFTSPIVLICIAFWSISLFWTDAELENALIAFVKHGKLLTIPILLLLLKNSTEAKAGLFALATGQCLVMVSSWLMAANIPVLWVARPSGPADPLTQFVPYADSYLDQSIMLAATAGIFWHLTRGQARSISKSLWVFLAFGCLLNVVVLMPGRTGYILAIATACFAAIFEVPRRYRWVVSVFTPLLLGLALYYSVPQFQQRVKLAAQELGSYGAAPIVGSSIGARLNMWRLSATAIANAPLTGYGIGNWTPTVKKLSGPNAELVFGSGNRSNPHQELLLWTVELGIAGAALFLGFLWALVRDTQKLKLPIRRATLSLVAMLFLTCLFNSPLYDDLMGDYFCITLGLLLALGLRDNQERSPSHFGSQVTD